MQKLLRLTMVTAEHSGKCGGASESRLPVPPYSLYTPVAWSGWRVQGGQLVCSVWIKLVALPFG